MSAHSKRGLAIAIALLALGVAAWTVITGPSPGDVESKVEQQLNEQFPNGMEEQDSDTHGSRLWFEGRGYTALGDNDEVLSCTDLKRDGKALWGAMYDKQSRKWKACSDIFQHLAMILRQQAPWEDESLFDRPAQKDSGVRKKGHL